MPGYSYMDLVDAIGAAIEVVVVDNTSATPFEDPQYNIWLPRAIEAAEQRIYRELDLLMTRRTNTAKALTANDRLFMLPGGDGWVLSETLLGPSVGLGDGEGSIFIVLEQISLQVSGKWQRPLQPVSKDYLEFIWPDDTPSVTPSVPTMFCQVDQLSVLVAPSPDSAYPVKLFGTIRPAPLSASNHLTMLSRYLPDLLLNATLVSWAGFQRDYGSQSDDPQKALSWEEAYQLAKSSALVEEFRKKYQSVGETSRLQSPLMQQR